MTSENKQTDVHERDAFESWAKGCGYQRDELERFAIVSPHYFNPHTEQAWQAWQARAALSADLAAEAVEELCQLGYTFKDGRLIPPDHVGELMAVVQASACGCQYGTCETKADRACRMTAEITSSRDKGLRNDR